MSGVYALIVLQSIQRQQVLFLAVTLWATLDLQSHNEGDSIYFVTSNYWKKYCRLFSFPSSYWKQSICWLIYENIYFSIHRVVFRMIITTEAILFECFVHSWWNCLRSIKKCGFIGAFVPKIKWNSYLAHFLSCPSRLRC